MRVPAANLRLLRERDGASSTPGRTRVPAAAGTVARRLPVMAWVVVGCLVVSALTLLMPSTPTYDPWAWILWGREITHLDLVTEFGPSWKPLPVMFTTVFSLAGHDAAPYLWLWIARAGALLGVAVAFKVARRLVPGPAGLAAGAVAGLSLLGSFHFVRDAALGNSEPMLAAFALWAVDRHLDGRRDQALLLAFLAGLLRPEVWPFLGLYGLWLFVHEPALRRRLMILGGLVPALWFLPELWGSGQALRAATRATDPNPGSAAFADHPALELGERFHRYLADPVELAALLGLVLASVGAATRQVRRAALGMAAAGAAWFVLVAGMTEAGYAGNQRYLILTTAAACVLAGFAAGTICRWGLSVVGRRSSVVRWGVAVAGLGVVAAAAPALVDKADNADSVADKLEYEASLWHDLRGLVDRVGKDRLLACGGVFSGPFQIQMLAYELGLHGKDVGAVETPPPGVLFRTRTVPDGPLVVRPTDGRYRQVLRHGRWLLLTVPPLRPERGTAGCPTAGPNAPKAPLPRTGAPFA